MSLVVDTGVLPAAVDRDDAHHRSCSELLSGFHEPLVIPSPVIVETAYWIQERLAHDDLVRLMLDVEAGDFLVADLVDADYTRIREIIAQYADTPVGFVDAAVLAVVERLGEPKLATLDERHFRMLRPRHVAALELLPGR